MANWLVKVMKDKSVANYQSTTTFCKISSFFMSLFFFLLTVYTHY